MGEDDDWVRIGGGREVLVVAEYKVFLDENGEVGRGVVVRGKGPGQRLRESAEDDGFPVAVGVPSSREC
ncbi:hypothetical protein LR48_Vigan1088s000100 [Vigna angularis]|uniref:Uncharacterized protein n=1 Tax=Phaseolus angularis TaxID=3914 RepID=A0A0L9TI46_PHAAN|nr:hypothetical protein LR48_Vigan1088s000100 [Vigna angularis]